MYLKYSKGQVLPVLMEGFMGMKIPCDATIVDAKYEIKADLGNGQFSEMFLNEKELQGKLIGNPQLYDKGYYQLFSNNKLIKNDSLHAVMEELMKIIKDNGIPEVTYNATEDATEFRFEGYYCYFSIFLRREHL